MAQYPESEYCTFLYADGRRCRTLKMPTRNVCIGHWKHDGQFDEDEAAVAELVGRCESLHTPAQVNRVLATLFRLTVQGKIPHRRAALLTYQCHLALCSMPRTRGRAALAAQGALPELDWESLDPAAAPAKPKPNGSGTHVEGK